MYLKVTWQQTNSVKMVNSFFCLNCPLMQLYNEPLQAYGNNHPEFSVWFHLIGQVIIAPGVFGDVVIHVQFITYQPKHSLISGTAAGDECRWDGAGIEIRYMLCGCTGFSQYGTKQNKHACMHTHTFVIYILYITIYKDSNAMSI